MKRFLLVLFILSSLALGQMREYNDDSILKLTEVTGSQLVVPTQPGYTLREPGNIVEVGDDLIFTYTLDKDGRQYVHYSLGNKNDLTQWKYMGRLGIYRDFFAKQQPAELEDPFMEIRPSDGAFILYSEDKYKTRVNNEYSIVMYYSTDWNYKTNEGFWDGGRTTLASSLDGLGKVGVYSFASFTDIEQYYYYYEGKNTTHYSNISIGYGGNRSVVLPFNDDWNIIAPDYFYKINSQYLMAAHGYYKDGTWQSFLAISDDPLYGWRYLTGPIKLPHDRGDLIPIYTDKWYYLHGSVDGMCLGVMQGDVIVSPDPDPDPDPKPDPGLNLPDPIPGVPYNVVLMREAKPLIYGLDIPTEQEPDRKRIIDLIDEISGGEY